LRQVIHAAMGTLAVLLRYLTWPQAALLALAALIFNATILAKLLPGIVRPSDAVGHRSGLLFYPLSLLALILVFRERLDIAGAAWAVMAFGDGAATLVGTRVGGQRLPWNPDKTWSGLIAFALVGSIGAVAVSVWVAPMMLPPPPWFFTWIAPIAAAVAAAFAETVPIELDDNVTVPFVAGLVLAAGAVVDPVALRAELLHVGHRIGWGMLASGAMAFGAFKVRSLTIGGAVLSTLIGAAIFSLGAFQGWLMYLAAMTVAVTTWRVGQRRRGPTPASHGAGSAVASCAIALIGAWLMAAFDDDAVGALVLTSAVAAWASEAVAVEFAKGYSKGVAVFASLMTAITLAGLFALAFPALRPLAPFIVLGVAVGSLIHRALANRLKPKGLINEDVFLFLNTLISAAVAWGAFRLGT
jgi:dolichol kinase